MKRTSILLVLLILCLTGCTNSGGQDNEPSATEVYIPQDNSTIDIDTSKLVKVEVFGCLPISTESIEDVLSSTGRFTYERITLTAAPGCAIADIYFHLDQPAGDDSGGAATVAYQILSENTTQIISYGFSKSAVNGDKHDDIKWGLDLTLHIFGTELTDETWADIMEVAAKSETEDAWGTDYEGFIDETNGIRLIYGNLGDSVQIDIRPLTGY